MIFAIDTDGGRIDYLTEKQLSEMDVLERQNLQEWIIDEPQILGEDLLVITSEYAGFEETGDRLDILAIDVEGDLVVVELKRDQADRTTDLQAIKYASYCATLTAQDIQQEYRNFWSERDDEVFEPEDVGKKFIDFLDKDIGITQDGWADFELDDKPRILLAAGEFGIEVTSPVMWLAEEYGMDITCTKIQSYDHQNQILLNSQQIIPVPEAEEYMTKRREKQEQQEEREWNEKDFYVAFGVGNSRSWDDARRYGFVSAGHGEERKYSKWLDQLFEGARIFVHVPGEGYVGAGEVTKEATRIRDFTVADETGEERPIIDLELTAENMGDHADDPEYCEYLVGVDWHKTVDIDEAYWEKGMFYFRNIACPIYQKHSDSIDKLYNWFEIDAEY